jgi:hypothetical protein
VLHYDEEALIGRGQGGENFYVLITILIGLIKYFISLMRTCNQCPLTNQPIILTSLSPFPTAYSHTCQYLLIYISLSLSLLLAYHSVLPTGRLKSTLLDRLVKVSHPHPEIKEEHSKNGFPSRKHLVSCPSQSPHKHLKQSVHSG